MGAFFPFDSHPMAYFIIWEMHGFPYQFPTLRENVTKPTVRGEPGKLVLILFPQYGCLFSIFHFMVYFITSGMHVFSHQFPILREKTAKPIEWGKPRKLVFILFPQYGRFFPLDSHPTVYFIAWKMYGFFHQIFHSIRNVSKTLRMGKAWEIGSHGFSMKQVAFSIRFPSCGLLQHMENAWVFSSISQGVGKGGKIHQMGKAWEIGSRQNPTKPIVSREPGKLVLILFQE